MRAGRVQAIPFSIAVLVLLSVLFFGAASANAANHAQSVAGGYAHTCAVTTAGGVQCWGDGFYGQLGGADNDGQSTTVPVDVTGVTGTATAVAAGETYTCALLSNGKGKCWGYSPGWGDHPTPIYTGSLSDMTQIAGGTFHTCAVRSTGAVACWGSVYGGSGSYSGLSGITAVGAGNNFSCVVDSSGGVQCWGDGSLGRLGNGSTANQSTPVNVSGLSSGVVALAGASATMCALTSGGAVKCWGEGVNGQLGDGNWADSSTPVNVSGLSSGVASITSSSATGHICAVLTSGAAKCWGFDDHGETGAAAIGDQGAPVDVFGLDTGVVSMGAGYDETCAILNTGGLKCWGAGGNGELGNGNTDDTVFPTDVIGYTEAQRVAGGSAHTCATTTFGTVKCWGDSYYGQIGRSDYFGGSSTVPVDVTGVTGAVTSITAGASDSCALLAVGRVKCWGYASGWGSHPDPTYISASSDVTALSSGNAHNCAVRSTGAIWCWGSVYGGSPSYSGLSSITGVAAGNNFTCVLNNSGGVQCWGSGSSGQLGNGSTSSSSSVVSVTGLSSGVSSIAAGASSACALLSTGAVKCWGQGDHGQLGDGNWTDSSTPVAVSGLTSGVASIYASATAGHFCAITTGGAAKCWGYDDWGQTGTGSAGDQGTPVTVSGMSSGAASIGMGGSETCAVSTAGLLQCWGAGGNGELGNGTTDDLLDPTNVFGLG